MIIGVVALVIAFVGQTVLSKVPGQVVAILGTLAALVAGACTFAGAIVLTRYKRSVVGAQDLFLELNRSRDPKAIAMAGAGSTGRARRWLARLLLAHDLVVGDRVEIRPWPEIKATLDDQGCLENLPFMPEMLPMCGQRATVFRCMHRLFDYRKTRRMRHMDGAVLLVGAMCDGSSHGGCDAACHTIWKSAWLRRVDSSGRSDKELVEVRDDSRKNDVALHHGTRPPHYVCQLTQLKAASRPIGNWSALNFLRPLVSGNVAPKAFIVGWLTNVFNQLQHLRQGVSFPAFGPSVQSDDRRQDSALQAGDPVVVRTPAEIRATLNDRLIHRGMGFESDMLKYCGRRCHVRAEVRKVIDIVSGEMRTMKTPAYILDDIHFSGERQLFNAQYEPLFWRSVWLDRVKDRDVR